MTENLYSFFRDLDRRCLAEGLQPQHSKGTVALKRRTIESHQFSVNVVAAGVLAGRNTFVSEYDSFSRAFRGLRRFVPKSHDPAWNERLEHLAAIVPNVRHFKRRSYLAFDNPVGPVLYGIVAGLGIAVIWAFEQASGAEPGEAVGFVFGLHGTALMAIMAGIGFIFGSLAMLKYRTRDPHFIHAREAAGYMDLNFAYCRAGDDEAWARMLEVSATGATAEPTRPD